MALMEKRQKKTNATCFIKSFPDEVIFSILQNLGSKDLAKLECVNSAWRQLLNNNDWWWKNRCFSDDLWLKVWRNITYFNCMNAILEIDWKKHRHCHYDDKEWDEMCEQIIKHVDNKNFVDKLPEMWNWKELNHLWDAVDGYDRLYKLYMYRRTSHPRFNNLSRFMNHLCSSISDQTEAFRQEELFEEWGLSSDESAALSSWKNKDQYYLLSLGKAN